MDQLPEIDDMTSYLAFGLFGDHEAWRESPLADIGPQSIGQEVLAFDPFPDASPWDKIFLPLMEPSFDQFLDTSSWDKMPLPPMGSQSIGEEVLAFDPFPDASLWGNMLLPVESPISNSSSILTGGNINLASEADYATGTDTKASTTLCSVPPSIGFLSKANLTIDAFPERKSRITSTIATPGTFLLGSESLPTAALVFDPESEYGFSLSDVSDEVADPKTTRQRVLTKTPWSTMEKIVELTGHTKTAVSRIMASPIIRKRKADAAAISKAPTKKSRYQSPMA